MEIDAFNTFSKHVYKKSEKPKSLSWEFPILWMAISLEEIFVNEENIGCA